jgi:hypothetical protein
MDQPADRCRHQAERQIFGHEVETVRDPLQSLAKWQPTTVICQRSTVCGCRTMNTPTAAVAATLACVLATCSKAPDALVTNAAPQSKGHCPTLERLSHADPAADAQAAVSRRDCHLLMLGGYVGTVPGGEMSFRREQAEMMPDTGDVVTNDACPALRPVAERYALKYNETVLALDRGTVPKCPPPTAGSPSQRLLGTPSTESKSQ